MTYGPTYMSWLELLQGMHWCMKRLRRRYLAKFSPESASVFLTHLLVMMKLLQSSAPHGERVRPTRQGHLFMPLLQTAV